MNVSIKNLTKIVVGPGVTDAARIRLAVDLRTSARYMVPIIRERRCETRCHSETIGVPLAEIVLKI